MARTATGWRNWAATASATPAGHLAPRDVDEAARALRSAHEDGRRVRPLGSGHSFTSIGSPDNAIALDLSHWTGIVCTDPVRELVTVRAGTRLRDLNAELDALGLAMINLGDIDQQTVAGAMATGTHGTGAKLGGLATQIEGLELLLADGSLLRCDAEENPELFAAARVGLGALGVVTTVTLRCVPAFSLAAREHPMHLDEVLERFSELAAANDHFEFYWFPYGTHTLVKENNRLPDHKVAAPLSPLRHFVEYRLMENAAFGTLCRIGRQVPSLVRPLSKLSGATWSERSYSDRSHRVFATHRDVRFVESEYAVPRDALPDVVRELRAAVRTVEHPVMFPIEVRVAAADELWMSTAHQRDTAYVAVHQFQGMPHRHYFALFESIVAQVGGRPHWGKMHTLEAATLRERYPRFDDFLRVRDQVDQGRMFRNDYLDRVLGA